MNKLSKSLLLFSLLAAYGITAKNNSICTPKNQCFEHNVQLQLADGNGFLVDNTQFWVNLDLVKQGELVTLQWPTINFQVGQTSTENTAQNVSPGGYLYTVNGFLPEEVRPANLVPPTVIGASNNGMSPVFSFTQTATELPVPPVGYQVQVTNAGELQIAGVGTTFNAIQNGPQILMPGSISYVAKRNQQLCRNVEISTGATNTTQFTDFSNNGVRDSHVCDAYDGFVAFAWADNSNIDQTQDTLNLMVAIGTVDAEGQLQMLAPVQITDLAPNNEVWDTAIAINREDPSNMVVSYGLFTDQGDSLLCRAVSFDYGLTWGGVFDGVNPLPHNGPLENQPVGGFGDARGVASDSFGRFWYSATSAADFYAPIFYVSDNDGVDFTWVFTAPTDFENTSSQFDYPQFCFGNNASGEYGLFYVADAFTTDNNLITQIGFIPNDLSSAADVRYLHQLQNSIAFSTITAADDGKLWLYGSPYANGTSISPLVVAYKSPGLLDENYAGVWNVAQVNLFDIFYTSSQQPSGVNSQPVDGFILNSAQSIIYDEARKALYIVGAAQRPNESQDMVIFLTISRDNGQTWSKPLYINDVTVGNRGFQSMALDTKRGDLVFGWYDGRNGEDDDFTSLEYFGAVVPAATLDALVNAIPLSDPTYIVPAD